jgi:hypothetical protein
MIKNALLIYLAQWAGSLSILSLAALTATFSGFGNRASLLERVRTVNDRFTELSVAVAEGYAPIPCASGVDGSAMGVRYVNDKLLGADVIDIEHPQAVMYEPTADGRMMLIAADYITSKGPASLNGQSFNFIGAPNGYGPGPFYELHVWAWKSNPRGAFADMNPHVTCKYAAMEVRTAY